jgi:hypothetical protein
MKAPPINKNKSRSGSDWRSVVTGPVWLVVLWLALVSATAGFAQGDHQDFDRVAEFIQRTEEILLKVEDAVRNSESARAVMILKEAWRLHETSYRLLDDARPLFAYRTSQKARQAGLHAGQLARGDLGFEERARIRANYLRELYDDILARAQETNHERALRFLEEAERLYLRAEEQYSQRNYEIAFNLLESAETMLRRAARLLFEAGGAERLQNELERTQNLIDRTHERLGENADPAAVDLLVQAEDVLAQAREAVGRGQPLQALRLAKQARHLAGQAASVSGDAPEAPAVQEQIDRWDSRYARVAEIVEESGNEDAMRLLERAVQHRNGAEERLAAGNTKAALRQIKIAHDLLHEAGELAR